MQREKIAAFRQIINSLESRIYVNMHVTYSYRCSSFLRFVKIIEIILPCSSFSICSFFFFDFKRKIGRPKEDAGDIGIVHIAIDGNFSRFYRWYFIATMSAFRRGNLTTNKKHGRIRASLRFDPSRDPRVLFDSTLRRFQSIPRLKIRVSEKRQLSAWRTFFLAFRRFGRCTFVFLSNICPPNRLSVLGSRWKLQTATVVNTIRIDRKGNGFPAISTRIFRSSKMQRYVVNVMEKVCHRLFIVSHRQTSVDKIPWNYGGLYSRTVYRDV